MSKNALQPVEQKEVLFYEDQLTAVRLADNRIFVPIRPLVEHLGIDWNGQRRRINRDAVLKEEVLSVDVTSTQGPHEQRRAMLCLPLDYLSGFLFGINADRVREEFRDRIIRYQRECYQTLHEAFQDGRLTADVAFDDLLASDSPAAQAYKMASAIMQMARQQLMLETQLKTHAAQLIDHDQRLEQIESAMGDDNRHVTPEQASQISQSVKTVAMVLTKRSGSNQYGSVYGELYRKFGITSYKLLPAIRFDEAMKFLTDWHQDLAGDAPF